MDDKQHCLYTKLHKRYKTDDSIFNKDEDFTVRARRLKCPPTTSDPTQRQPSHHIWMVASLLIVSLLGLLATLFSDVTVKALLDPQSVSLSDTYAVDYENVQSVRLQNMLKYSYNYSRDGIDRRRNLSLQEYRDVYDAKWPVIITDVVPQWKASNWTPDFFHTKYAREHVVMRAFDLVTASDMSLALPVEMFYKNVDKAHSQQWTYINDELFIAMRPELISDIGDYRYLEEDLFELFPSEVRPWNAMLLWGMAFSRSALHIDPYNWTGTNAVLYGTKTWKLYPPLQDELLYVMGGRKSGFPLDCFKYNSPVNAYEPDHEKYPMFKHAKSIDFDQKTGELLLIPTGWFHQAFNREETIAVSSQVMNLNNYRIVMEEIIKVGNLNREDFPLTIDSLSPADTVKVLMSLLPSRLLAKGAQVTEDILRQMRFDPGQSRYQVPAQLDD